MKQIVNYSNNGYQNYSFPVHLSKLFSEIEYGYTFDRKSNSNLTPVPVPPFGR